MLCLTPLVPSSLPYVGPCPYVQRWQKRGEVTERKKKKRDRKLKNNNNKDEAAAEEEKEWRRLQEGKKREDELLLCCAIGFPFCSFGIYRYTWTRHLMVPSV